MLLKHPEIRFAPLGPPRFHSVQVSALAHIQCTCEMAINQAQVNFSLSFSLSLHSKKEKRRENRTEQNPATDKQARKQDHTDHGSTITTITTIFPLLYKKKRIKTSQDSNHPLPYIHLHRHSPQIYYAHDTNSFPTATRM